ncbi:GNAT family N-acetyltransferase [Candidatus Gracilibacteria bacterium]|nr:GNAT family N-acetyltransferase [Candidatus Gracilibacteria bacterium]NUJ99010.1 GNAT family N-acetyltransferase [Candidatus Gracilibacteria bacterium]
MQLTKAILHTTDTYINSLKKSGIETVMDMIMHTPRDYEDRTNVLDSLSLVNIKEKNTLLLTLISISSTRTANNKLLTKAIFEDKSGFLSEGVWFNRQYFANSIKVFEGKKVIVSGKVKYEYGKLVFSSPDVETDLSKVSGEIVPIYPDANYIPGKWIESKMELLKNYFEEIQENLPLEILKKYNFLPRKEAFLKIHFPKNKLDISQAKERLAYEELYLINYKAIEKKYQSFSLSEGKSIALPFSPDLVKNIIAKLPFSLTDQQKISLFQILKDMELSHAMRRLLEGDVGTGKTIVALISAIHAIKQSEILGKKIQVAFMAPTEILARQHFESMGNIIFEYGISLNLLVGSTSAKQKESIKKDLKQGNLDIIVGTHAIIQEDVSFHNLGFVVIDEQHRFGVKQREVLESGILSFVTNGFRFIDNIEEADFDFIKANIICNLYSKNKHNLKKEDFSVIKDKDKIIAFGRIFSLSGDEYELANLWVDPSYRGEKLGNKLIKFLYMTKINSKEKKLFVLCKEDLFHYYEKLGFDEMDENYSLQFFEMIKNARLFNEEYKLMQLKEFDIIEKISLVDTKSSLIPHSLNMTATPIPRTLALTLYGDQDLSIISEYPKGRKEIFTRVAKNDEERQQIELFVRSELEKGRQVFWISPLVEESEKIDLANAIKTSESLREIFAPFSVGLLHGKMKAKEKESIMRQFQNNEIQVLSSTSVVEVGVDIPNASIMCIEGAERFGLSQLHQFRGRVGRGKHQSYCYLFPSSGQKTDRLRAMERTNNGFQLAEIDLEIRGPGEVYGVRQSGIPDLKMADLRDLELISTIREDIESLFKKKK